MAEASFVNRMMTVEKKLHNFLLADCDIFNKQTTIKNITRSHSEMVGDMLRVTLNFTSQKLCISSQGRDIYSHQKLNMYIYWFSSESGYRRQ